MNPIRDRACVFVELLRFAQDDSLLAAIGFDSLANQARIRP